MGPVVPPSCTTTTILALVIFALWLGHGVHGKVPEASSTLLQMHRLYVQQPPHDRTLYDTLHVSSNATAAEITKAYRRLSRRYHPDKATNKDFADDSDRRDMLTRVQEAYEILKTDTTRLPYHRYGLVEPSQAVLILTGRGAENNPDTEALRRLMGYHRNDARCLSEKERLLLLASDLVEKIRPVVEGRITEHSFLQRVAADCDRLKKLPLGAQILRCVGRAYKHAGQTYLRCHQSNDKPVLVPERLREGVRQGKLLLTAAGWWGRAALTENLATRSTKSSSARITYQGWTDTLGGHLDEAPTNDEIREKERQKAQAALLQSTQVEALWKICKIDLYRKIRRACDLILSGEQFFYPIRHVGGVHGWVGSRGAAVETRMGLTRTANILRLMGEVMVERSKEGTAWME